MTRLRLSTTLLLCVFFSGCSDYRISVNDRTVYEPVALFTDYRIDDAALRACVEQAIRDTMATRANQLKDLNCANAGIRSLTGINVFTGLERVRLDDNHISDLTPLFDLRSLALLQVRNNQLSNAPSQFCLTGLQRLAIEGNAALHCESLATLKACGVTLESAPAHCAAQ